MSYRSFGEFVDTFVNNGKVFIELDLGDHEFFSSDRARELAANLLAAAEYAEAANLMESAAYKESIKGNHEELEAK